MKNSEKLENIRKIIEGKEELDLPIQMSKEDVEKITKWILALAVDLYEAGFKKGSDK